MRRAASHTPYNIRTTVGPIVARVRVTRDGGCLFGVDASCPRVSPEAIMLHAFSVLETIANNASELTGEGRRQLKANVRRRMMTNSFTEYW